MSGRCSPRENASYRREKQGAYALMATSLTLNYLSMRLVQIVVMLAGTVLIVRGGLSIGDFVAFLLLVARVLPAARQDRQHDRDLPARDRRVPAVSRAAGGASRTCRTGRTRVEAPAFRGDIRFERVVFGYGPERPVLDGLDLEVRAGETVAVVGPSGAGKTTLCSLLPRFYDVDAGRITHRRDRHPRT